MPGDCSLRINRPTADSTNALSARPADRKRGCGAGKEPEGLGRYVLSFRRNDAARFPLERTESNCSVLEKVLQDVGAQAVWAELCLLPRGAQ